MNVNHDYCHYYVIVYMKLAPSLTMECLSAASLPFVITVFGPWWLSVPDTEDCGAAARQPCCTIC